MRWQWAGLGILVALFALAALFFGAFPRLLAWKMHEAPDRGPAPALSAQAQALHSKLLVVDLHGVTLLWPRDLLARGTTGHVDLARLTDGNVALQVFSVATRLDWPGSDADGDGFDLLTPLAIAQGWRMGAWNDPGERALYQAERLRHVLRGAGSRVIGVRTKADMDRLLLARTQARENGLPPPVGAVLSLRDSGALAGEPHRLQALFEAGFRMAVPPIAAILPNTASASGASPSRGVLARAARPWLERMEQLGMAVDVDRMSPAALAAVLATTRRPVVASRAGLRGACDRPGNLDDGEARGIAGTGGLIAISFTPDAVCGTTLDAIVRSIRYAVDLVGVDHVALGSNFDGGLATPIDAAGLAQLTQALMAAGFSEDEIARISGANAWRLLRSLLPD
jgi:microsomal dipeptidase-like Zn-dependent dipeptidase